MDAKREIRCLFSISHNFISDMLYSYRFCNLHQVTYKYIFKNLINEKKIDEIYKIPYSIYIYNNVHMFDLLQDFEKV